MARWVVVGPDLTVTNVVEAPGTWAGPGAPLVAVRTLQGDIGDTFDPVTGGFLRPVEALEARRGRRLEEIRARHAAVEAAGYPHAASGRRVAVDDMSRTNLAAMVLAALLSKLLGLPWGAPYSEGWIAMDNVRIPLPTADAGVALGAAVGAWYGGLRQFARDAKDAVLAAADPDSVAVDWTPWSG
jgi:hypothetical protein